MKYLGKTEIKIYLICLTKLGGVLHYNIYKGSTEQLETSYDRPMK